MEPLAAHWPRRCETDPAESQACDCAQRITTQSYDYDVVGPNQGPADERDPATPVPHVEQRIALQSYDGDAVEPSTGYLSLQQGDEVTAYVDHVEPGVAGNMFRSYVFACIGATGGWVPTELLR